MTGMKHMPTGAFSSVPMTISYSRSDRASQPSACAQDRASPAPAGCLSPSRHRPCQPGDCDPRRDAASLTTAARPRDAPGLAANQPRPGDLPAEPNPAIRRTPCQSAPSPAVPVPTARPPTTSAGLPACGSPPPPAPPLPAEGTLSRPAPLHTPPSSVRNQPTSRPDLTSSACVSNLAGICDPDSKVTERFSS